MLKEGILGWSETEMMHWSEDGSAQDFFRFDRLLGSMSRSPLEFLFFRYILIIKFLKCALYSICGMAILEFIIHFLS